VRIGSQEFDWEPTVYAGAEYVPGNRGTDYRLEDSSGRSNAAQRKAARNARRRPYEEQELAAADDADGGL
jgi:GTP-binding protein